MIQQMDHTPLHNLVFYLENGYQQEHGSVLTNNIQSYPYI